MEFELKFYKLFKNKQYLTDNRIFFIYNSNNLKKKKWILIEQKLNKSNLKYSKIYNKLIVKNLSNSIYLNLKHLIHGSVIFIKQELKTDVKIKNLINLNNAAFVLLCIKLNKKIYSIAQIKNINILNYNLIVFLLFRSFKNSIKTILKIFH